MTKKPSDDLIETIVLSVVVITLICLLLFFGLFAWSIIEIVQWITDAK
jgi:hypothetical protein